MTHRGATLISLALAAASLVAVPATTAAAPVAAASTAPTAAAEAKVTNGCVKSRPEPGTEEKVKICWTVFKPARASRDHKVPLMMHSHGWGGSRTTDPADFERWLDAGYGVLSFDQRGFGDSGGFAHVENPRYEGRDNLRLIRMVSKLAWVKKDGPGDPRLGAMGGSYGGGFQFLGAFEELKRRGKPVYDALAPEITWHDLGESLAPQDVPRAQWATLLGAAAQPSEALEPKINEALAEGVATGNWPDGSGPSGVDMNQYFKRNGPSWHVSQGRRLDIPVLFGQGATDTLFSLQQGFDNWRKALTKRSRSKSIFVGYNGGHVLPGAAAAVPPGNSPSSDPCSKELGGRDFERLSIRFMNEHLKGRDTGLTGYGRYHLATPDSTCTTVSSVRPNQTREVGTVATPEAGSPWLAYPVAEGPIRIAGSSYLTGDLTTLGATNRAFYGLAVGTSPADAKLVQNNVYPLNVDGVVTGQKRRMQLPAVAVDVAEGENLYVIASAVSDTFGGAQSRTPGVVLLENTVAHLPVVGN
ncbi:MAG: CocE/NonD family hydrolase [Nocardioides sp.]